MSRIILKPDAMPRQFLLLQQENKPTQHLLSDAGPTQYLFSNTGSAGPSAYSAALMNGFVGTEGDMPKSW